MYTHVLLPSRIKARTKATFGLLAREMDSRVHRFPLSIRLLFTLFLLVGLPKFSRGYLWPKQNTYTTRWDKVNLDEILDSKRLLQHYFNCLMSKGPCPPDGRELKRVLPEALATGCAKCTKSQIEGSVKVIRYLREFEPIKFNILANKYDPEGIYRRKYFEPPPDNNEA